jgi:hypothetical protein
MDDRKDVQENPNEQAKKAYVSPRLEVFGVVTDIAAGAGSAVKDASTKKGA